MRFLAGTVNAAVAARKSFASVDVDTQNRLHYVQRYAKRNGMSFTVRLDLPPDVEQRLRRETPDLSEQVKEAYVLELFRRGKLSHYELSRILGLDRFETDAYLKRHNVFEGSLTVEDLEADVQTLRKLPSEQP